jgi:radical SAM protein with 4Fe4S-binding SPASM domain
VANRRLVVLDGKHHYQPKYVVWEITLACDQPCTHCGSRAGEARSSELSTAKALEVVEELAAMGAEEVVLIGGEAYLHPGYLDIARALALAGIRVVMTTGGRGIDAERARAMREAGFERVSVSIDGLEATHDRMRAARGSFRTASAAIRHFAEAGIYPASNLNLNRSNAHDLEALYEHLKSLGVRSWQIQLTAPLGRAADRTDMLLQPYDLLTLVPRIAALKQRGLEEGVLILPGNNLGYFGPEEGLLRSQTAEAEDHWQGCMAGKYVMGIESDGAVKGCPSLQTSHYVGGRLTDASLEDLWQTPQVAFTRERTAESLRGSCAECPFGSVCLGGCSFTAHAFFGEPGDQPYCHFRALEMKRRGLRERLVPTTPADGLPFDHGLFDLVREAFDSPEPELRVKSSLVQITRKPLR